MFTYENDPINSPRDAVRVLTKDTEECEHSATDEEIAYFLSINSSPMYAAADAMDAMAANFARLALKRSRGDVSMDTTARAAQMREAAATLRARAVSNPGGVLTGITLGSTKAGDNGEGPNFWQNMTDNPEAPGSGS